MKTAKLLAISFVLMLICVPLAACKPTYPHLEGRYKAVSLSSESIDNLFSNLGFAELTLNADGKFSFVFALKNDAKVQISGKDTPTNLEDDVYLSKTMQTDGKFDADTTFLKISSGALKGEHKLETLRITLTFTLDNLTITGIFVYDK